MLQSYLWRGLKAGLLAGLAFGLFVALVSNPTIAAAEGLAGGHGTGAHHGDAAGSHDHGSEGALSLPTTEIVGILGGVFWALLLGVVTFGAVYYFLEPAIPGTGAVKSAVLAGAGFLTVSGAPWLVVPPQPPGATQALPTDTRTAWYAGMMAAGLTACLLAGLAYTRLREQGRPVAVLAGAVPFVALVALSAVTPANPVELSVPPSLATAFRAQVVFGQVMLWAAMAASHAWLVSREDADTVTLSETGPAATAD